MSKKRVQFFRLVNKKPVPCEMMTWAMSMESIAERHVANDYIGDVQVSTVFLGLDHQWSEKGPPHLFETMVFGGKFDSYQERSATWEQAETVHARWVANVRQVVELNANAK